MQLIVNDGALNSNPATVMITAGSTTITLSPNPLNLTLAPQNLTVTIGAPAGAGGVAVTLSGYNSAVRQGGHSRTALRAEEDKELAIRIQRHNLLHNFFLWRSFETASPCAHQGFSHGAGGDGRMEELAGAGPQTADHQTRINLL